MLQANKMKQKTACAAVLLTGALAACTLAAGALACVASPAYAAVQLTNDNHIYDTDDYCLTAHDVQIGLSEIAACESQAAREELVLATASPYIIVREPWEPTTEWKADFSQCSWEVSPQGYSVAIIAPARTLNDPSILYFTVYVVDDSPVEPDPGPAPDEGSTTPRDPSETTDQPATEPNTTTNEVQSSNEQAYLAPPSSEVSEEPNDAADQDEAAEVAHANTTELHQTVQNKMTAAKRQLMSAVNSLMKSVSDIDSLQGDEQHSGEGVSVMPEGFLLTVLVAMALGLGASVASDARVLVWYANKKRENAQRFAVGTGR